jgi:hypothetical protein
MQEQKKVTGEKRNSYFEQLSEDKSSPIEDLSWMPNKETESMPQY